MTKRINLALQGGGAHGAFTWGVLDRLLDEDDVEIAAISGTSAGALNGAALKAGLLAGGREGARENLDWLWDQMGAMDDAAMPDWMQAWLPDPWLISQSLAYSPGYTAGEAVGRMVSPYAWGPLYRNPLERIVERFDFGRVCAHEGPAFFVCATNVRDGKIRVFQGDAISTQSILASACLPTLFQAVEVEDPETGVVDAFWDGGYTGNPALFPLYDKALPDDVVIVNINPLRRDDVPVTPPEIQNRINEISFNSSLLRELRAIEFVQRLLADGSVKPGRMKDVRVHMIADDALMNELSVATKLVPVPTVLAQLKEAGRRATGEFLRLHKKDLNERQTVDLRAMFG
ncbi:patatin-like phospholipase family protein [Thalassococcus sp. CAU 1522]|uniref:Patatin-like phospholipase family protein n=1 Tax=Thalassococcus arenae TaxID=2851652 RepID=A0ABS6NA86_9RHOB|nr:patatin-like phospholipase family protein [Thalassococcus arenae]MBV2360926.1 patatin-like phospholipase family protein [Thalassococcus arenae]